jgi:hypothetical protein
MNIIVFAVILALVLILFIAAEYLDVLLHVAAFGILFVLGVYVLAGTLQYQSGETQSINYTTWNGTVNSSLESRNITYASWNDSYSHIVGFLMCCVGVGGFFLVYGHYGM